jgi:uncharacterized cupin superfamily protein
MLPVAVARSNAALPAFSCQAKATLCLSYRLPMDEARMERTEYGLTAATEGWFAVNIRDAAWVTNEKFGAACIFEGDAVPFAQIGYTLAVLGPGQSGGLYHREDDQEDFLVLSGECVAIIEGQERRLRAWDFVHCPPGTEHIFVGAGDAPCVIFMPAPERTGAAPSIPTRRRRCATAREWRPRRRCRGRRTRRFRSGSPVHRRALMGCRSASASRQSRKCGMKPADDSADSATGGPPAPRGT